MQSSPAASPLVWGLFDDRPGTMGQVQGIVERLEYPAAFKRVTYSWAAGLPNALRGRSLMGVNTALSDRFDPPWPDIIVAAGRRLAPVALYLKKRNPKAYLVHLMDPDMSYAAFDMVVLPQHDGQKKGNNILYTLGAPHALTQEKLSKARESWRKSLEALSPPRIALLIGGDTKEGKFTEDDAAAMFDAVSEKAPGASLLVTTSRRTAPKVVKAVEQMVAPYKHHFYADGMPGQNPYQAYLAWADAIVVTGDSVSMVSEAAATGRAVYIFPTQAMGRKHKDFAATMVKNQYARVMERFDINVHGSNTLNEAGRVAQLIRSAYIKQQRS